MPQAPWRRRHLSVPRRAADVGTDKAFATAAGTHAVALVAVIQPIAASGCASSEGVPARGSSSGSLTRKPRGVYAAGGARASSPVRACNSSGSRDFPPPPPLQHMLPTLSSDRSRVAPLEEGLRGESRTASVHGGPWGRDTRFFRLETAAGRGGSTSDKARDTNVRDGWRIAMWRLAVRSGQPGFPGVAHVGIEALADDSRGIRTH